MAIDGTNRGAKGKYETAAPRIIDTLKLGMTARAACNVAGISEETYYQWIQRYPDFAEAVKGARDAGKQEALDRIREAAKDPKHWQAAAWYLERSFPQEYRQRVGVDVDTAALEREIRERAALLGLTVDDDEAKRAVEAAAELLRKG